LDLLCLWFYDEQVKKDTQDELMCHLKQTFRNIKTFNDKSELIEFLADLEKFQVNRFFFISSGDEAESLCQLVNEQWNTNEIYVYLLELNRNYSSQRLGYCTICNRVDELFKYIAIDLKKIAEHSTQIDMQDIDETITFNDLFPTFGLFNSKLDEKWFHFLSTDSLRFLLFRLCFQIIIEMDLDETALDEMCSYFRSHYRTNTPQLQKIDQLKASFDPQKAIYYYTKSSCVFYLINQALRSEDMQRIFKCRHCIIHLQKQLTKKIDQPMTHSPKESVIYRGQKMPTIILLQLQDNIDSLVSLNGFLSTTKYSSVAADFASVETHVDGCNSVFFEMEIDTSKSIPFCRDICSQSHFSDEGEILFSIGAVWKLKSVERDEHYWTIKLSFCDEVMTQLTELDQRLTNGFTYLSMGNILRELGDKSNAENFYYRMLDTPDLPSETIGHVYYNIGTLAAEQGRYEDALRSVKEAERILPSRSQDPNDIFIYSHNKIPTRLWILNTLGLLYQKCGKYTDARQSFIQALKEDGHDIEKAFVNDNLGSLEFDYGNYDEALKSYTNAVNMTKNYIWVENFKKNWDRVIEHISETQNQN